MPRKTVAERTAHAQKVEQRRHLACRLWLSGVNFREIGQQLRISHECARQDVKTALEEIGEESETKLSRMREQCNARLAMARRALFGKLTSGDTGAVNSWIKIEERFARLNGLDAPSIHQKIEEANEVEEQFDFSRLTQPELDLYIHLQEKMFVRPTTTTGAAR